MAARVALGAALLKHEGGVTAFGAEVCLAAGERGERRGDGDRSGWGGRCGREVETSGVDFHATEELGEALGDRIGKGADTVPTEAELPATADAGELIDDFLKTLGGGERRGEAKDERNETSERFRDGSGV